MENISIFDFIGTENDDVYKVLQTLIEGEEIVVKGYTARLTDKFYELENEQEHVPFKTLQACYTYLREKK